MYTYTYTYTLYIPLIMWIIKAKETERTGHLHPEIRLHICFPSGFHKDKYGLRLMQCIKVALARNCGFQQILRSWLRG